MISDFERGESMLDEKNIIVARKKAEVLEYINQDMRRISRDFFEPFRKYYQSFIYWLWVQNENFAKNLTAEELTTYFLTGLNHPLWFRIRYKEYPFDVAVEAHAYIEEYMDHADELNYMFPIHPKEEAAYHGIESSEEIVPADESTKEFLRQETKRLKIKVEKHELESMDYWNSVSSVVAVKYKEHVNMIKEKEKDAGVKH